MRFTSFLTNKGHLIPQADIPGHWRILMTGVTSIHGWPIYQRLRELLPKERFLAIRPHQMSIPDDENVQPVCITDQQTLKKIKATFKPTHIIHAAGVCDLDVCEERPLWAQAINQGGANNMATVFKDAGYLMFLSTDLVYSGNYPPVDGYNELHPADPVSVAGKTFLAAEKEIENHDRYGIVRLGLPMGDSITGGKGAVDFIESRFKRNLPMTLFDDELRSCIDCDELSEMVLHLLIHQAQGIYHLGGEEAVSLYQIGEKIIKKGRYPGSLLRRLSRHQEKNGPPRIGNVALNSSKLQTWFDRNIFCECG